MYSSLRKHILRFRSICELAGKELKSPIKVRLRDSLRMWRAGFLGESYVIYDLAHHDWRQYVSDYARFVRTGEINGRRSVVLDDKLCFAAMLHGFEQYAPQLHAAIAHHRIHFFGHSVPKSAEALLELCIAKGHVVLKPIVGGAGKGVFIIEADDSEIVINGEAVSRNDALPLLGRLEDYLVTEFVDQHEYSSAIFPSTTNTVRALTMWDDEQDKPFLAIAVHRFGRHSSGHVDNWTQGGLSAHIDLESGELGKGVSYPVSGKLLFYEKHPDTEKQIEGVRIPHWEFVKSTVLEIASALSFVPYIGWDIIVTKEAIKIIEGNNRTDVNLLQVHRPLLADPRVARFYRNKGVLRRRAR
jgi:hypothetical protein